MAYDPTIGMLDIHDPVAMEEYTRAGQAEYEAARKQHSSSDNWNAEQYHAAAGFVPKLAGKVLEWVELKPGDRVLDIGCGDGVLTRHLLPPILPTGYIKALDSSISMLCSARASLAHDNAGDFETPNLEFELWDCRTGLPTPPRERPGPGYGRFRPLELYDLLFSNAALHWILRPVDGNGGGGGVTERFFTCANRLLVEGGKMVFEMGGRGNVAEFRAALLMATARRIGIERARMADPWFFPSGSWMRTQLTKFGFEVEKMEMEYRPTPAEKGPNGGIEGWVRLMGKAFLEAVEENEREGVVKEVCEALKTVVGEEGEETLGYVRLRVKARKVWCV